MKKWKKAFYILLGIDIIFIMAVAATLIYLSSQPERMPSLAKSEPGTSPVFTVNADKGQITKLINGEISKRPTGNLTFYVDMEKTLDIIGSLKVLGLGLPFTMRFNPTVDDKGNIVLKEKDVKLGAISLPESQVLKFIEAGTDLPSWVYINPDKKEIYIDLNSVIIKERFYLKAKEIDLAKNRLIFSVFRKPETNK